MQAMLGLAWCTAPNSQTGYGAGMEKRCGQRALAMLSGMKAGGLTQQ